MLLEIIGCQTSVHPQLVWFGTSDSTDWRTLWYIIQGWKCYGLWWNSGFWKSSGVIFFQIL